MNSTSAIDFLFLIRLKTKTVYEACLKSSVSVHSQEGLDKLPAGDGNRVWFPEMIKLLRSEWNESMTFLRLIELCASIDELFQQRRPTGPSLPPGSRCPKCGRIVSSENFVRRISVRATILALGRFGIASSALTKKIEKEWAEYRTQNGLDLYGYPA